MQPENRENMQKQLAALRGGAGVYGLDGTGWLRVTGGDRLRWLAGMLTNGIQQMEIGTGSYNFILSAQGRIQGDCTAFVREKDVLLETSAEQVQPMMALLDKFIIMDDVELADVSAEWHGIGVAGPKAGAMLESIGIPVDGMTELGIRVQESTMLVVAYSPTVPRFEVWYGSANEAAAVRSTLTGAGAVDCDTEAVEAFRVLSGIPRYGTDIRDKDLPQETAQTRALHFAKGCYIGQEIVERIRSRGAVHRTFTGFLIEGELPAAGTALELEGKIAGEITSAAVIPSPDGETKIALGYVRREAQMQKKALTYAGGSAMPVELPFALDMA